MPKPKLAYSGRALVGCTIRLRWPAPGLPDSSPSEVGMLRASGREREEERDWERVGERGIAGAEEGAAGEADTAAGCSDVQARLLLYSLFSCGFVYSSYKCSIYDMCVYPEYWTHVLEM